MDQKLGLCPFRGGGLTPRLTQRGLGRGLLPYQVASSSIQPFGHNKHEPKIRGGGGSASLFEEGGGRVPVRLTQVAWAEVYLHTKWHLDPSSRLPTIDMG